MKEGVTRQAQCGGFHRVGGEKNNNNKVCSCWRASGGGGGSGGESVSDVRLQLV